MRVYHKILRSAGVVVAIVLLFDSGLLSETTKDFSSSTQNHLANVVGVTAGVAPTELNQITAELTARERELAEREAALTAREIDARARDTNSSTDISTYILSSILFILLVLIILNYILDYVRARRELRYA